ncbi:hypothetical protein M407DRAFT_18934 [Tulasnella calospora MUT 4182]|uniref:DRBM domain-containing protein n=1 Tax=Tulasnella calospora MUT 4182 TaxID=1051891 RepID=A0A0C3QUI5_9AGAM|nr:hypothetical protein M407DRAFT_18934 [Tulasnella calospora MUT 4182]
MAAEYTSILHNLKQRNLVAYREDCRPSGPQHDLVWQCCIYVQRVNTPLRNVVSADATEVSFEHQAGSRKEARRHAARNVLYAIHYYEAGQEDVLTPAGKFASQPAGNGPPGN